jgi:outer membrane protein assembly factor BamB
MITSSPRLGVLLVLVMVLSACGGVAGDSWAGISSNDDVIYVAYARRVVAINPASGASLWEYPDKDNRDAQFFAVPVVDDGTLYIGDYKGRVHAVNLEDGKARWVYEPEKGTQIGPLSTKAGDRVISSVAVDSNKVFFGLGSRNVVAISRDSGEKVWEFPTDHGVWGTPLYIPAAEEGGAAQLYIVSLDHHFYALNPETGNELWNLDLGGAAPGSMTYDEGRNWVYVGTFISELVAIDLAEARIVDRYETLDWVWGRPALEDGILYFGDLKGNLYAVRVTDGGFESVWKREELAQDALRGTPLLVGDLLIVGSQDKFVYAVSKADGSDEWKKATRGEVLTDLLLAPGSGETPDLVIAGTSDREELVIALIPENGDIDWRYSDAD